MTYLEWIGQRIRADHLLCNDKVKIHSQVDDDIIDVSSENNDTLSSKVALDEDQETVDQETNHASFQGPGECLRCSFQEKCPPQRLIKEL